MRLPPLALAFLVLAAPLVAAQTPQQGAITNLRAETANQRITLRWDPVGDANLTDYRVQVFLDGNLSYERNVSQPEATFGVVNGRVYTFLVEARFQDGSTGPPAAISATTRLKNDLTYLAVGLVVVWLGLFGYAALLARHESRLEEKLDQLLKNQYGRNPP